MSAALRMPSLLVVGGRDSSGGAGIDADRASVESLAIELHVVVTAETEQDDRAVHSVGARDPRDWLAEALRVASDGVDAIKLGLLPGADHVTAAAELIEFAHARATRAVVLDPVLSASSGARFLDARAVEAVRTSVCKHAIVITPNVMEAGELTNRSADELARSRTARLNAAHALLELGVDAVVLKGGHATDDPATDLVLARAAEPVWLAHPRIDGGKIRGSGCRFATRLAAELALGHDLVAAAKIAGEHVLEAIRRARQRA